jgi:hypothetical protein
MLWEHIVLPFAAVVLLAAIDYRVPASAAAATAGSTPPSKAEG